MIRGNKIVAASCWLPSPSQSVDSKFGTRHRAALGVSEQSDCVVLVVSEETGDIRIANDGNFGRPMTDEGDVKTQLSKYLVVSPKESNPRLGFLRRVSGMSNQ